MEVGKCGVIGQMAGKPHHFSTILHPLFKVQGLSVSRQQIEACLQIVVKYNPWFRDEVSFNLEFGTRLKKMLNKLQDREKIFQ